MPISAEEQAREEDEIWKTRKEQCMCNACWDLKSPTLVDLETSRLHLETYGPHPDAEEVCYDHGARVKRAPGSKRGRGREVHELATAAAAGDGR